MHSVATPKRMSYIKESLYSSMHRALVRKNIEGTKNKIREANRSGRAKISLTGPNSALTVGRLGNHVRCSVSVYNNHADVHMTLEVFSRC